MIDASKLKKDLPVIVYGRVPGTVRGVYLSAEGIIVRVNINSDSIVDQNVHISDVQEVTNEQPQG